MSKEGELGVFRYFCFNQHSYFRLANVQPFSELSNSPPFSFPPLIRYTATSLLIAHCVAPLHRYLTAHCSLLITHCVAPLHRYTATFIAIACRGNQYCKIKRKIIKQYKILIINILYNIIIYNNIIYFYSIVSFSAIFAPHVRIDLMRRCDGATHEVMSSEQ